METYNIYKNGFAENEQVEIFEPRIYFGTQTNKTIITNTKNNKEYDYPTSSNTNAETIYNGNAGLNLGFLDRLIMGIKEGDLKIAFSGNITKDSKIIIKRNIIDRAKQIMPYLTYDNEPYMVITDNGKLVWVLDAYTTSNNYPYSQEIIIDGNNNALKTKINYIRNSVKVLIDSYDGTIKFYITDKFDPIVIAYKNMYNGLFEESEIPSDISKHIIYSKYLYDIQSEMIERYHSIQAEVLYRQDDVWSIAKESTSKTTSTTGTKIDSYYTLINTNNKEELGLVIPYTSFGKQNIISYLVGTYDANNKETLKIYKFKTENAILRNYAIRYFSRSR